MEAISIVYIKNDPLYMEGNLEMIETNPSPYIFEICSSAIKRKNQPIKQPTNKVKE